MIRGIGVDVVDIGRFEESLERTPALRERVFTPAEARLPLASLAARFAAKEALAKALETDGGLQWLDAEVHTAASGRPYFAMSGTVAARAAELGVEQVHLSISHDAGIASAFVIVEGP
ncbi:holo-ACP synthase [Alteromonas gracilis]